MELLVALAIGALTFTGTYLMLRLRSFPVILGLTFLSYAVNLFIFAAGRLKTAAEPIVGQTEVPTDPLPQALVLTAIVISFGMTAVIVMMGLGAYFETGEDRVDAPEGRDGRVEDASDDPVGAAAETPMPKESRA
ncbi:Na+/H+ antiporter subunit C [Xinfangfangia pollutisoli]|uniref:Na+/H+ antiporter subunit C n=1 Tax=Xinfangfangia pollutisoli TaxID=2865960 RepID=UPI001CD38D12|nr:Na+/H+ antiporter subunit C [Xinfangfangia pollutisoli]